MASSPSSGRPTADVTLPLRGSANTYRTRDSTTQATGNIEEEPAWWSMVPLKDREERKPVDVSDKLPFLYKEIPSRVNCKIPLSVKKSKIPGGGRGVFMHKDVKAGELIFSIDQPLLSIVGSGYETCSSTCDNCFAIKTKLPGGGYLQTVPGVELKFEPCKGCSTLHYCSEECRVAAWQSYHKHECPILRLLLCTGMARKDSPIKNAPTEPGFRRDARCMIRLLRARRLKEVSNDEWAEFLSLEHHLEAKQHRPTYNGHKELMIACSAMADIMVDEITLLKLYYAMHNNMLDNGVPYLKTHHYEDPSRWTEFFSDGSLVLEPFASMVNHSCGPNTFWINEGKALRFRAAKDISAGSELTISYSNQKDDYKTRQESLKFKFHFTCTCEICQKGDHDPTGKLRDKLVRIENQDKYFMDFSGKPIERTIQDLKNAGFGLEAYGMFLMHQILLQFQAEQKDYKKALRTCSVLYFGVLRMASPPIPFYAQLDTLLGLFYITYLATRHGDSFQGADAHIPPLAEKLYLNFYELYVRSVEKWTGGDSKVTKFSKKSFDELLEMKREEEATRSGTMSVWQRRTKVLGRSLLQM